MATFNQQHQRVRHQINGEHVYVGADAPTPSQIEQMIEDLLQRLRAEQDRQDVADAVLAQVQAAHTAMQAGDRRGVSAFLSRAAEVAAPVATLADSVTAVANLATLWHD